MRVTDNMIAKTTVFNMQRSVSRFLRLQTEASSGRRINKPSDDPLGIQRDLGFRTEIAKNGQLQKNIKAGQNWMFTYDSIHSDLKNFVQTAKEVAVTMSNGTYDAVAREGAANEIASIFEQIMQMANTEKEGKHIFSGYRTDTKPIVGSSNGVVYNGDFGQIHFQVDSGARLPVNLNGSEAFLKPIKILGEQSDLDVGVTGGTLVSDLHNGAGLDTSATTFTITDENLSITSTIDIAGDTTVGDVLNSINGQLAADGITNLTAGVAEPGNSLMFDTSPNPEISLATRLEKLNQGNGVDMSFGQLRIHNGAGIDVTADLSGSETLNDVITAFQTALVDAGVNNVSLEITNKTALKVVDNNVPPLDLTISEVDPASTLGEDLGILGSVGPLLIGRDLNPELSFSVSETTGQVAEDLGILNAFSSDFVGTDLDPRLNTNARVSDLNAGNGFLLGTIEMWQGASTRTIDLNDSSLVTIQDMLDAFNNSGLDITASINAEGRGIQVVNNDPTKSFTIEDTGGDRAARELGIFGSTDMMGTLIVLENVLRNDDQEGASQLLDGLDDSMQLLLNNRAKVGARAIRLETTANRLADLELSLTKSLSEIEDADITRVMTDLATHENNYQASLMATARIVQPSLLNFLR